jgi:hypothetical protein
MTMDLAHQPWQNFFLELDVMDDGESSTVVSFSIWKKGKPRCLT